MRLIFLFSKGGKFDLNLPNKLNRKNVVNQLADFQAFCLLALNDHKRYASTGTTFKIPTYQPTWIGVETEPGKVLPLRDTNGDIARIKGNTIVTKTGKGKDAVYAANPDFCRFLWSHIATLLGEQPTVGMIHTSVPVLDNELIEYNAAKDQAKQLPEGNTEAVKPNAGVQVYVS